MPIAVPKVIRCKRCKKKHLIMLGDVRPQRVVCPRCGHVDMIINA